MTQLGDFRDDYYNSGAVLGQSQVNTTTQGTGTVLTAANMPGAGDTYIGFSGQTAAQAITTDTAVNIVAQLQTAVQQAQATALKASGGGLTTGAGNPPPGVPNLFNLSYTLTIINNNTSSGAITLTGGAGVTIVGTNTIAINTIRVFVVQVTSTNTVTLTNVGSGTN